MTLKTLTDKSLICIFHFVCGCVSILLATIINRTGELVALRQITVLQYNAAAPVTSREEERYRSPRCSSGPSTEDRWSADSPSAPPYPLINLPPGDTWPTQPIAQKGLSADSCSENSHIFDLL